MAPIQDSGCVVLTTVTTTATTTAASVVATSILFDHNSQLVLSNDNDNFDNDYDDSNSDFITSLKNQKNKKKKKRDMFSTLPTNLLLSVYQHLTPSQLLEVSRVSKFFYQFIVSSPEMNEVWYFHMRHEELEQKKREERYLERKREAENRSVQMMRSFSSSSAAATASDSAYSDTSSKQAKRNLRKKDPKALLTSKTMKRADKKKNWCKIYVERVLQDNSLFLESFETTLSLGPPKIEEFKRITINEPLPDLNSPENAPKPGSKEAKTQMKIENRLYYKSIRSKPKGKKPSQADTSDAISARMMAWKEPAWTQDSYQASDFEDY